MKLNNLVIVWGNDGFNSLGLIRQIKDITSNITLLINGKRTFLASISKYCTKTIVTKNTNEGLLYLMELKQQEIKPVLIPSNDITAEVINNNQLILKNKYYIPYTNAEGSISKYDNKLQMCDLAKKCGFIVPDFVAFNKMTQINSLKINYPVIIKPD